MFSREAACANLVEGKGLYNCLLNAIWRSRATRCRKRKP